MSQTIKTTVKFLINLQKYSNEEYTSVQRSHVKIKMSNILHKFGLGQMASAATFFYIAFTIIFLQNLRKELTMHKMDTLTLIETFFVEKNEQQVRSMDGKIK